MGKPARKRARKRDIDEEVEVIPSAAPGASQAHLDAMLKTLKRREPGAMPPPLTLAPQKPAKPQTAEAGPPKDAALEEPETPKDVVRSAMAKAHEQDASAKASRSLLRAPKSRTSHFALAAAGLLVVGMAAHLYVATASPVSLSDYATDVADILPVTELHNHGSEWIGSVDAGWSGAGNAAVANEACQEVRRRVLAGTPLTLYTSGGQKLVTCGP